MKRILKIENGYLRKKGKLARLIIWLCFGLLSFHLQAKIVMPSILSDNMVLQADREVTIWGWTTQPSEEITVRGSWSEDKVKTQADSGRWYVKIKTPKAGGPYEVYIEGHETIRIKNVLIGEVWLGSGQSNMEMPIVPLGGFKGTTDYKKELAKADQPLIRLFTVHKRVSDTPQDTCEGEWVICSPETAALFSATAYFFADNIHEKLGTPVGVIHSSWGGTNAESWMPEEVVMNDRQHRQGLDHAKRYKSRPSQEGKAYNAMIYPIRDFSIAGVIWYQGENNRYDPLNYGRLFTDLIKSWRLDRKWDFPFYYVQIAPYNYKDYSAVSVREAQGEVMQVPNTGMVVTNDIGDLNDIHPQNKKEVGRRLARWALAKTYGYDDMAFSGPVYKSMEIKDDKVIIQFDHTFGGLKKEGKQLQYFQIAGDDKIFKEANASIKGETIVVSGKDVKNPVAVRFAFSDQAIPNLYNSAGLPAPCFRTDKWDLDK